MVEILLRCNRRIAALLIGVSVLIVAAGGIMMVQAHVAGFAWIIGLAIMLLGTAWIAFIVWIARQPRLAIDGQELLVYLHAGRPLRVPLDIVEVFFLGQGPATGNDVRQPADYDGIVAANIVVRLAEAAKDWHRRDVNVALGVWQDGYITVRGLWCESINGEVVKRMNRKLAEIKRQRRRQDARVRG